MCVGSMCVPRYTHGGQRKTCRSYISLFTRDPWDRTRVGQAWWWTLSPAEPSCWPGINFKSWLWAGSRQSRQLLGHDLAKQPRLVDQDLDIGLCSLGLKGMNHSWRHQQKGQFSYDSLSWTSCQWYSGVVILHSTLSIALEILNALA